MPQTEWLQQQTFIVSQSWRREAQGQGVVWTGLVLSEGCQEESIPCLFPTFEWFAGHLWPSWAGRNIALISAFIFMPAFESPPFIRTSVILDQGPTLLQYDFILTNYICSNPIS